MREQLSTWIELSTEKRVPVTMLLFTQAFAITQDGLDAALANAIKEMPDLVVEEATAAVEIDRRARRELALSIAEREIEEIEKESSSKFETTMQIQTEEAKQSDIDKAEALADAVAVASGKQSLLADEIEALDGLRRRQALAADVLYARYAAPPDALERLREVRRVAAARGYADDVRLAGLLIERERAAAGEPPEPAAADDEPPSDDEPAESS